MVTKKKFDDMMKSILNLGPVKHKRPPKPTRKDVERKFKLKMVDGTPVMQEVE